METRRKLQKAWVKFFAKKNQSLYCQQGFTIERTLPPMKNFSLFAFCILALFMWSVSAFASLNTDTSITVGDYSIFLNESASVDPDGLYDEKMSDDSLEARGWRLEGQKEDGIAY